MTRLIAITGGIGAGKSVVARCVSAMGFDVYDCDSRAKILMANEDILRAIDRDVAPGCVDVVSLTIDRRRLAAVVFNDKVSLERLNSIVHGAVREDIVRWQSGLTARLAFIETAILYQSKLDKMVDEVWEVTAPTEIRVQRVMTRGEGMTEQEARARIDSQNAYIPAALHPSVHHIINDNRHPVVPQIIELLGQRLIG